MATTSRRPRGRGEKKKCSESEDKGGGREHLRKRVEMFTRLGRRPAELEGCPWDFNICRREGSKNHGRVYRALRVLFGIAAMCATGSLSRQLVEPVPLNVSERFINAMLTRSS